MRTLLSFLLFAGLIACNPQPATPTEAPPAQAQTESGEPMGATTTQLQRVYVGWHLVTATGVTKTTGGTWVSTKAFLPVPQGQTADPAQLLNDLIRQLTSDGTLAGVDLAQTAKNRLEITSSSLSGLRDVMILESWMLPQKPK